jgi:hypothetical protein
LDIARARLSNQLLGREKKRFPGEVVSWLGAVQAQDFAAAKWALGLRLQRSTDAGIEKAYNTGEILRTHVMRPTWHFLAPRDIRAVLALRPGSGPEAPPCTASWSWAAGSVTLPSRTRRRCAADSTLTRTKLADRLAAAKIEARGQRLAYILMDAEFAALICSGPRKGKQFTYALLEERVPKTRALSSEEALGQWTLRYFLGHGPLRPGTSPGGPG